ncbi:hypothetical protein [Streptomyces sp. NPDC048720]|uniref:hypothetical protein n=1 Tax=Streptomyces sp. NPDC048720 TaxID=3365588 RepID=UPI003716719D
MLFVNPTADPDTFGRDRRAESTVMIRILDGVLAVRGDIRARGAAPATAWAVTCTP